jgi:uncharacterized membrane protein YgcG
VVEVSVTVLVVDAIAVVLVTVTVAVVLVPVTVLVVVAVTVVAVVSVAVVVVVPVAVTVVPVAVAVVVSVTVVHSSEAMYASKPSSVTKSTCEYCIAQKQQHGFQCRQRAQQERSAAFQRIGNSKKVEGRAQMHRKTIAGKLRYGSNSTRGMVHPAKLALRRPCTEPNEARASKMVLQLTLTHLSLSACAIGMQAKPINGSASTCSGSVRPRQMDMNNSNGSSSSSSSNSSRSSRSSSRSSSNYSSSSI